MKAKHADPTHPEKPSIDPRRLRGEFYTPDAVADILTEWALTQPQETVLDPSFGGGAFLNAAAKVLDRQGVRHPGRLVFGVDIDRTCLDHIRVSENLIESNFVVGDFLGLSPKDLGGAPFGAIVGNPPYVRHHWLNEAAKDAGRAAMDAAGVRLPATASAWAYFLVHALSFIAKHGRLAMLVPEAIQQADYARSVREALLARFEHVYLVHIRSRLFERTDEAVVAVAASGYGKPGSFQVEAVERTQDLAAVLNRPSSMRLRSRSTAVQGRLVETKAVELLKELEKHPSVKKFSDLATLRIGLVTGANGYFIKRSRDLEKLGVPRRAWLQVVSRTCWLSGLDFTERDLQDRTNDGQRTLLVRVTPEIEDAPGVQQWIAEGIEAEVDQRFKCTIRTPWFCVPLPPVPDAFATCTSLEAPILVLNRANCRCTNTLHGVYWNQTEVSPMTAAIGILTSAVSTWAELHGRRYGGGVLKMEPGTWNRMPVPTLQCTEDSFDDLNQFVRRGLVNKARALADELVLKDGLGLSKTDIRRLQRAQKKLRAQRRPARDGSGHA